MSTPAITVPAPRRSPRAEGAGGGGAQSPFRLSTTTTQVRDSWIRTHGHAITVAGQSSSGMTLYYLPSAAA